MSVDRILVLAFNIEAMWKIRKPALILLSLVVLLGCAPKRIITRPPFIPSSQYLIEALNERDHDIQGLTGRAKITYVNGNKKQSAKLVVVGLKPSYLRFDILDFWGRPALSFTTDGTDASVLSYSENRLYKGDLAAHALSPFWPPSMGVQNMISVISGNVPLIDYGQDQVEYAAGEGLYLIQLTSTDSKRKQRIWLDVADLGCVKSEIVDLGDRLVFRVEFDKFREIGRLQTPFLVKTYMPEEEAEFTLEFKDLVLNSPITEADFDLKVPEGVETVYVN
jgi:outer membrane lipoprotein-sorting protein